MNRLLTAVVASCISLGALAANRILELSASGQAESAKPTDKAVLNGETLTFYYDEVDHSSEGTVYEMGTGGTVGWTDSKTENTTITTVIFDPSFKDFQPTTMSGWFQRLQKLATIKGLENVDTSNVTSMQNLFRMKGSSNSSIRTLDLSTWDTAKVTNMSYMFQKMSGLVTVYVSDKFSTEAVTGSGSMFDKCNALVGGAGTKFSSSHITADYAHIDTPENPGYFTSSALPPTISSVEVSYITDSTAKILVEGTELKGGKIDIEVYTGEELAFSTELSDFGVCDLTGLEASTTYTVKVTATNKDGATAADPVDFTTLAPPAKEWSYDAESETISWGGWIFGATVKDAEMSVGAVTAWPDDVAPLDFSLPVAGGYTIVSLDPQFGQLVSYKPEGVSPQCERVGTLTLPGEGLKTIGTAAFAGCANAVGPVSFPSTLTTLSHSSFADCASLEIDGETIPDAVTTIPQYCFRATKLFGDLVLTNVTAVADSAFKGTSITSVTFGPRLVKIDGNYDRGAFQGCTSLTNVVLDATSRIEFKSGFTFKGCSALKELDLRSAVNFAVSSDRDSASHISGCSKLKKITFGAGLTNLMCNAMAGATALEEVVFEGVPPVGFQMPYLSAYDQNGAHETGYDNQKIVTYVHHRLCGVTNEAGKCWNDYAAKGVIGPARKKPANNTTWATEYVYEGVDLANRPLLTMEPNGFLLLVR